MIPGLLASAVAAGVGGIVESPAYYPVLAEKTGIVSATATATFTINPDGTWGTTGTGYPPESGNWFLPTTPGAGAAYEVRITPTLNSGAAGVVTNAAAGWVALNVNRAIQVVLQRLTFGLSESDYSMHVQIRLAGGAIVSSNRFDVYLAANVSGIRGDS